MKVWINLRKTVYITFFSLLILFAFYPAYFEEIPFISSYDILINLLLVFVIVLGIIRVHCSNKFFLLILIYIMHTLFSTIINHGNVANAIWGRGILLFALVWGMYKGYQMNSILFEKIVYKLMYILVIINLITVFVFPEGMITDNRGITNTNFFLGNYNAYIQYLFLSLICGYLYQMQAYGKVNNWWILILGIGLLFYSQKFSATSCFGLLFVYIYSLLFNKKCTRKYLNLKIYTIINTLFFVFFVWNTGSNTLLSPVLNLLHKDITFTGRTLIWQKTKGLINESPLLGIGLQEGEEIAARIGMVQAVNAHNLYLNILLTTGIIGFIIFVVMFCYTAHKVSTIKNLQIRYFIEAVIGIFMFMSQFETYNIKLVFFLMMLFCLCAEHPELSENKAFSRLKR